MNFINEIWKDVTFDEGFTNTRRLRVSNFGRVCSCTQDGLDTRLIKGSKQGGYAIIRFRLLKPRTESVQLMLNELKCNRDELAKKITIDKQHLANLKSAAEKAPVSTAITEQEKKLALLKNKYDKNYKAAGKARAIYMGLLVHRLVAGFFCKKPSPEHTLVIHKDFNKLNNHYSNLQWVTPEESIAHQQHSPYVIEEKKTRAGKRRAIKTTKLTVTRVMLIKKRLLENTPMSRLARQFKVTETQIARIKKGENWKDIPAAT